MARKTTAGVKLNGLDKVIQKQRGIQKRFGNLQPAYRAAGPVVVRAVKKGFSDTVDPDGKKWKPKKPVPVKFANGEPTAFDRGYWKRGKFRPKRKTGVGLTAQLSRTTSFVARAKTLVVFNNKNYAGRFHGGFKGTQKVAAHSRTITRAFGKKLKKPVTFRVKGHSFPVNQPARKFLGASSKTRKRVVRAVLDYAIRAEAKA